MIIDQDSVLQTLCSTLAAISGHLTSHTWAQSRSRLNWWNLRPMRGAQWMPVTAGRATSSRLPARVVHWRLRTLGGWGTSRGCGGISGAKRRRPSGTWSTRSKAGLGSAYLWSLCQLTVYHWRMSLGSQVALSLTALGVGTWLTGGHRWLVPPTTQVPARSLCLTLST